MAMELGMQQNRHLLRLAPRNESGTMQIRKLQKGGADLQILGALWLVLKRDVRRLTHTLLTIDQSKKTYLLRMANHRCGLQSDRSFAKRCHITEHICQEDI
jgi:hypothetical protein